MVSSFRTGILASLFAMGLAGCGAAPEESFDQTPNDTDELKPGPGGGGSSAPKGLALGDSIAFGMDPLVTTPQNPAAYKGYPEVIASIAGTKVSISNAACPGETSGSFLRATDADNGCRQWKAAYSLHANYEDTQIAFAERNLAPKDTKYVSVGIGANDLLILQRTCAGDLTCINTGMPGLLAAYGKNLGEIYDRVRKLQPRDLKDPKKDSVFVAVTTYATNYNDALSVGALTALNNVTVQVMAAKGGRVADAFAKFKTLAAANGGDACAAGLLIKLPSGACDIHPSPKGRDELAKLVADTAK